MEWEYNDYELDNRLNNMMWTISEDYAEESDDLKRYASVSKDLAIYFAVKTRSPEIIINENIIARTSFLSLHPSQN